MCNVPSGPWQTWRFTTSCLAEEHTQKYCSKSPKVLCLMCLLFFFINSSVYSTLDHSPSLFDLVLSPIHIDSLSTLLGVSCCFCRYSIYSVGIQYILHAIFYPKNFSCRFLIVSISFVNFFPKNFLNDHMFSPWSAFVSRTTLQPIQVYLYL